MKSENRKNKEGFFSFHSLERKFGWTFGILIVFIAIMASLAYTINVTVWTDAQSVRTINAPLIIMVEQVIGYDAMLTSNAYASLLHSTKGETAGVAEHKIWYDKQGILLDNLLKIEAPALIAKSRRSLEDKQLVYGYLSQLDEVNLKLVDLETRAFAAMAKGNNDEAHSLLVGEAYHDYKTQLRMLYDKWYAEEARVAEYYQLRALSHNLQVRYINLTLAIILILASMMMPILIFRFVIKPIKKLTEVAEDISSGDLDIKIPENLKKNKSEVGSLAKSFDKLLESSHFALKTLVESKMARKYENLYTFSKDAIMIIEPPDWKFTSGNSTTLKMFNVKDEKQFNSLSPGDLSPEKQPDGQLSSVKAKKMIDKAMKEGSNFFEWTHKRYKGENFSANVLLSRVEEGGKTYLQATVRDLTKTKKRD